MKNRYSYLLKEHKRIFRGIVCLLLTALILLPGSSMYLAASGQVIVLDDARLFSDSEKSSLVVTAENLAQRTGWDVFVVTTDDTDGREARDFAEDFFMDHYTQDDGFVCLIDMDNREIYMATSGDVIYYVTDDRKEELLDEAFACVSDGDYEGTIRAMLDGVSRAYSAGIDSSHYIYNEDTGRIEYYTPPKTVTAKELLLSVIIGVVSALGMNLAVSMAYTKKGSKNPYSKSLKTDLQLHGKADTLVNRFTTTRRIPRNPPSSSGGRSSGGHRSTSHRGSGGHSFGGGGRKF